MKEKSLSDIQVGDAVVRILGGVEMRLLVTKITADEIQCGAWVFSRKNGAELDPDLGWNETHSGSFIQPALGRSPS